MSDEINAQECALQLMRVCSRLIRNARQLAELDGRRELPRWKGIPVRHIGGKQAKCDRGQLLSMLTTKWKIDVDDLAQSDPGKSDSWPSSDTAKNLNGAIVDFGAMQHDLKRLRPNANDFIEPMLLELREPSKEQTFGNVQRTTMTEAVLDFSNEAFEKNCVSLIDAICELGRIPEPERKVVERQICREFRSTVPKLQGKRIPPNKNSSLPIEAELLEVATTKCKPSEVKAWLSEQYAIRKYGVFKNLLITHEWLAENFDDSADDLPDDLRDYKLPSEDTWRRHVRAVRNATGTQVNTHRRGRKHGGSVVDKSDI